MAKIDKITRIKYSLFALYILTFFTPIYSKVMWGTKLKVSITELGAGSFFLIFFLVLIVGTITVQFVVERYYKIVYLVTLGFMTLFQVILFIFKEDGSVIRLTWYVHLILIVILFLAHFRGDIVCSAYDKIITLIKQVIKSIKTKITDRKESKNQDSTNPEVAE